jgi:hypothetical protein
MEDAMARKRLSAAADIVRKSLSSQDAEAFSQGSEMDRSAYFLRAVAALPAPAAVCSRFALYMVDADATTEPGGAVGSHLLPLLDDSAVARWSELDAQRRCEVIAGGRESLLKTAQALVQDGSEVQVAAVAKRLGADITAPRRTVIEMFGAVAGSKYDALPSVEQKLHMYKSALLMQLCWGAALFAL